MKANHWSIENLLRCFEVHFDQTHEHILTMVRDVASQSKLVRVEKIALHFFTE